MNSTGNRADSPIALPPNATSEQIFAATQRGGAASVTENGSTVTYYNTGEKVMIGGKEYTTDTSLDF